MKKNIQHTYLLFLFSTLNVIALEQSKQQLSGISFFNPRAQNSHNERNLIGWHAGLFLSDNKTNRYHCAATPLYSQSVRDKRMAYALFGKDTLTIIGSEIQEPHVNDLLADYFGLSPTFSSTVMVEPTIHTFLLETDFYINFDTDNRGLFMHIKLPVGYTSWHCKLHHETIFSSGVETLFPAGYQSTGTDPLPAPFVSFITAMTGDTPFGAINPGIEKGRITGNHTKKGFTDLQLFLGYNFELYNNRHAGVYLTATAPLGSRPKSIFLFEPLLGNGRQWGFGIGFTGHIDVWDLIGQELGFFLDICFSTLFGSQQHRSFDFKKNGFGSRYLLLKEFDSSGTFTGHVTPAINVTTLSCKVHNDIMIDATFMFGYTNNTLVFDIGYDAWIRSKDKISLKEQIPDNRFGIKGIQNVYNVATMMLDNSTQSTATIAGNPLDTQQLVKDENPVFIHTEDLNLRSAASPFLLTNKIFWYLGYKAPVTQVIAPFFGIGFEIEFEGINERSTVVPFRNTLSQCSIFLRGGTSF